MSTHEYPSGRHPYLCEQCSLATVTGCCPALIDSCAGAQVLGRIEARWPEAVQNTVFSVSMFLDFDVDIVNLGCAITYIISICEPRGAQKPPNA